MLCDPWALPVLFEERCTLCGLCVEACPQHGIHLGARGPVFDRTEECEACGSCEDACPAGAIVTHFEITDAQSPSTSSGGHHGG